MIKIRSRKTYIALFCIYLAAVAVACFTKPSNLPDLGAGSFMGIPMDKVLHFILFLPFPILASMSLINLQKNKVANLIILLVISLTGIGIAYATEAIQAQIGYRSYDMKDLYADSLGISVGALLTAMIITCLRLKK